jgi:hypothetical protein
LSRHPGRLTKRSGEVPIRKFTGASEHVECDAPANVGVEELFGSALLPWRETASPLQWQCRDVTVSTGNVYRKRERNVVNEEFGSFLRSCREGRAHGQQQIARDRIPNAGTRRMTQFLARATGFFADALMSSPSVQALHAAAAKSGKTQPLTPGEGMR